MPLTAARPTMAAPLRWLGSLLLLLLLWSAPAPDARAQTAGSCSVTSTSGMLGTVSSFSLQSASDQVSVAGGLSCENLLSLLPISFVRVTLTSVTPLVGSGQSAGYSVPFTVYSDAGYTQPVPIGQTTEMDNIAFINILNQSGSSVPLYVGTNIGANVPAGTYTGTVNLNWQYAVCVLGVGTACLWSTSPGVVVPCLLVCGTPTSWGSGYSAQITVTLTVTKSCLIDSAPNVDFGSQPLVANFSTTTQSVTVHCTVTEGYTLAFDMGDHPSAPWRQMQGSGGTIRYNLYYPGTTTVWNTVNPLSMTGLGGAPVAGQAVSYQAIVDPGQPTPPVGTYVDNVRVIVNY